MDCEPDCGAVGTCGVLGRGPCLLSLSECGFPGEEALHLGTRLSIIISLPSVHTSIALGVQKTDIKTENPVSRSSEDCIANLFCVINFTNSFETGRDEVMRIILWQYLVKILLPFHYQQSQ